MNRNYSTTRRLIKMYSYRCLVGAVAKRRKQHKLSDGLETRSIGTLDWARKKDIQRSMRSGEQLARILKGVVAVKEFEHACLVMPFRTAIRIMNPCEPFGKVGIHARKEIEHLFPFTKELQGQSIQTSRAAPVVSE